MARLRALVHSRTLRAIERSFDPPTAPSDDLVPRARRVDLVAFPRIVTVSSRPAVELDHGRSDYRLPCPRATASTTALLKTYFMLTHPPSPAPDSGNLHPARCIIPQPSLLLPAPAPGNRISRSPLELTARQSIPRPRLWPRSRRQTHQKPRNHYRDKEREKALTPKSPTTTAIPQAQRLLTTRHHLGSWTLLSCLLRAPTGSPKPATFGAVTVSRHG